MKNLPLLLLALICILFATTVSAQTPEQARNFQIDATHTGSITTEHLTPPLRQRWTINFGQPISYPLIADCRVFVTVKNATGNGTTLYALNATNGATIWSFNLGGSFPWSAACYENGRVFAINGGGLLRSFDGATGNLNWSVQLQGQFFFMAPPTVLNGVIYTGGAGSGGTVYAGWTPSVYMLGTLVGKNIGDAVTVKMKDRVFLAFPTVPSDVSAAGAADYSAFLQRNKLSSTHAAAQASAIAAARILVQALERCGKDLSRERLITTLEGLYEYDTGLMPKITFGPNRRIGALGAYVVTIDPEKKLFPASVEWIAVD